MDRYAKHLMISVEDQTILILALRARIEMCHERLNSPYVTEKGFYYKDISECNALLTTIENAPWQLREDNEFLKVSRTSTKWEVGCGDDVINFVHIIHPNGSTSILASIEKDGTFPNETFAQINVTSGPETISQAKNLVRRARYVVGEWITVDQDGETVSGQQLKEREDLMYRDNLNDWIYELTQDLNYHGFSVKY